MLDAGFGNLLGEKTMFRLAKKWVLLATLAMLLPVTIVCDVPGLAGVLRAFDYQVYYDDYFYYYDYHDDCWFHCDDEWFFDFDWWW
ncbi:MAG: hypothetical protein ACE5I3_13000 [Phycisphaerae bacterium]